MQPVWLYRMGAISSAVTLSSYAGVDGLWSMVLYYGELTASWSNVWSLPAVSCGASDPSMDVLTGPLDGALLLGAIGHQVFAGRSASAVPGEVGSMLSQGVGGMSYVMVYQAMSVMSVSMLSGLLATVQWSLLGGLRAGLYGASASVVGAWCGVLEIAYRCVRVQTAGVASAIDVHSVDVVQQDRVRVRGVWMVSGAAQVVIHEVLSAGAMGARVHGHRKAVLSL